MNDNKLREREPLKPPFMDQSVDLEERIDDLLGRMTLEEKFSLCAGKGMWTTNPVKRLGIKEFKMSDGPHGVRNATSTYFPIAKCRASTWNPELSNEFGKALAKEVRAIGYHMILGPGINIDRTPLNGRTFEYQTEDPYLNKELAIAVVRGIQSQRIAACVKHYLVNNQETNRKSVSVEVSERVLREIYLPAFEAAVKEADTWSIMASYNKINGVYACENKDLLIDKLRTEWGFRGFVVSDWWGAVPATSTESCMNSGLNLEMPGHPKSRQYHIKALSKAFEEGKFTEETLNKSVADLLRVMFLVGLFEDDSSLPSGSINTAEHQALARRIAEEGIILLKNEHDLLPLDLRKLNKIAVIGPNARLKTAKGGGSATLSPPYEITPLEGIKKKCEDKVEIITSSSSQNIKKVDVVLLFVGLNHDKGKDTEGQDREDLELPREQVDLINKIALDNPKTVVILINGSPVKMEWLDKISSVVEAWYAGQEAGHAIADVLFGDVNPSGKLPLTFPKKLSDSPAHDSKRKFPGDKKVYYDEGIFVGYRHFDKHGIEPLFPFGHGLSYTEFTYEKLEINNEKLSGDDTCTIRVDITNTGERPGAEVVQLYVQDVECSVERPVKELKRFKKVRLNPEERTTLTFELEKNDLSFYDEKKKDWIVEPGLFKILIGSSSRDIRLIGEIEYQDLH
ncbi:MAG: glycoside hydrolase family 3 C-terminal domain-containing protein [Candidatus Hermodarchaeota archaeon]